MVVEDHNNMRPPNIDRRKPVLKESHALDTPSFIRATIAVCFRRTYKDCGLCLICCSEELLLKRLQRAENRLAVLEMNHVELLLPYIANAERVF